MGRGTRWWCWNLAAGSGWRDTRAFWVKQGRYRGTGGTGRCAGWNYPRAESLSRNGGRVGEKSGKKWFGRPLGVAAGGGGPRKIFFRPCGVRAGRDEHVPRMLGLGSSDPPKKVTFQHSHDRKKVRAPKKFTILYGTARSGKFPIVNFQAVQRAPILNFFWDRNCVGRLYMGEDLFWGPGGQTPKGCWRSSGPAVKVTCYFGATWRLLASGRAMSGPRTCLRPPLDNLEYQSSGQRG